MMTIKNYKTTHEIGANTPLLEKKTLQQQEHHTFKDTCKYNINNLFLYRHFSTSKLFKTIKKQLGNEIHIEIARGDDYQNKDYCTKTDKEAWTWGVPIKQGQCTDLKRACKAIKEGKSMKYICENFDDIYVRYWRGLYKLKETLAPPPERDFPTEVYYYYGEPGVGKSRRAYSEAKATNESIYYKPRGDWWDGYEQQPNVIIDDFYGWIKYDELLKIMDRYPYRVPVKGGYQIFNSKRIWITSNIPIDQLYKHSHFIPQAIERRCTKIEYMQ